MHVLRGPLLGMSAGCVLVGCALYLSCGGGPGDDGRPASGRIDPERTRREQLEAERLALLRRIEAKQRIATEVAAGRMMLVAAIARFRALAEESPYYHSPARWVDPAQSEEERLGREVIACVGDVVADKLDATVRRLEKELHEHLVRQGLRPTSGGQ
jgi:hypothetical protein